MTDPTPLSSDSSVFISYARADDEKPPFDDTTQGWVTFFWHQLRFALNNRGAQQAVLWLDRYQIEPAEAFTPKIHSALEQAKLIVAVLSNNWIQRDWCQKELEMFGQIHASANAADRVLPVSKDKIKYEDLPILIQGHQARESYKFFGIDQATGELIDFYYQGLENKNAYNSLIKRIADYIVEKLGIEIAAPAPSRIIQSGKTVFIAIATGDLRDARQRLISDLQAEGIEVLPADGTPPDTAEELENLVKNALSKAEFAVHLLSDKRGVTVEGGAEPIVNHQLRLARETSLPRMLCVPYLQNPIDVIQNSYGGTFEHEEIHGESVTELAQWLRKKLKSPAQPTASSQTKQFQQILIAAAHADDEELAIELANQLQGCGPVIDIHAAERYTQSESALATTAVLIPWGAASKDNLQTLISQLSPPPAKITCLLLPGGNDAEKNRFFQSGIFRKKIAALPNNPQESRVLLQSLEILPPGGGES